MFSALHQLLVNDLAGIILSCLDMDRLLDDSVRPAPQGLPSPVLHREEHTDREVNHDVHFGCTNDRKGAPDKEQ